MVVTEMMYTPAGSLCIFSGYLGLFTNRLFREFCKVVCKEPCILLLHHLKLIHLPILLADRNQIHP